MKKAIIMLCIVFFVVNVFGNDVVLSQAFDEQQEKTVFSFWETPPGTQAGALEVTSGNWRFKDIMLSNNSYYPYDYYVPAWGDYYLGHWRSGCSFTRKEIELFPNGGAAYEFIADKAANAKIKPMNIYAIGNTTNQIQFRVLHNGEVIWPEGESWQTFNSTTNPMGTPLVVPELKVSLAVEDIVSIEFKSDVSGDGNSQKISLDDFTIDTTVGEPPIEREMLKYNRESGISVFTDTALIPKKSSMVYNSLTDSIVKQNFINTCFNPKDFYLFELNIENDLNPVYNIELLKPLWGNYKSLEFYLVDGAKFIKIDIQILGEKYLVKTDRLGKFILVSREEEIKYHDDFLISTSK